MSDGPEKLPHPHEDWLPHNPWVLAGAVMLAPFMEVLDTTITNVALPHIAGNLSASIDESTWVLTSYLVSNAIFLPLVGLVLIAFRTKKFLSCLRGAFYHQLVFVRPCAEYRIAGFLQNFAGSRRRSASANRAIHID